MTDLSTDLTQSIKGFIYKITMLRKHYTLCLSLYLI